MNSFFHFFSEEIHSESPRTKLFHTNPFPLDFSDTLPTQYSCSLLTQRPPLRPVLNIYTYLCANHMRVRLYVTGGVNFTRVVVGSYVNARSSSSTIGSSCKDLRSVLETCQGKVFSPSPYRKHVGWIQLGG